MFIHLKELNLCNKIKYVNLNILRTRCCKPLIFQTQIKSDQIRVCGDDFNLILKTKKF